MEPRKLIMRALEEDRAAIRATCLEAQIAHRSLAELMRKEAANLVARARDERL